VYDCERGTGADTDVALRTLTRDEGPASISTSVASSFVFELEWEMERELEEMEG
jgi:hypothetical protein